MKNNIKLLKQLLEKIKNTPNNIIEKSIDKLSKKICIEEFEYNLSMNYEENKNNVESENNQWMENLAKAA